MFNGQLLRSLREERRLSAHQLAQQIGVSRSYINLIELARKQPSANCQRQIAAFFNRTVLDFQLDDQQLERTQLVSRPASSDPASVPVVPFTSPPLTVSESPPDLNGDFASINIVLGVVQGMLADIRETVVTVPTPYKGLRVWGQLSEGQTCYTFQCISSLELVSLFVTNVSDMLREKLLRQAAIRKESPDIVSDWKPDNDVLELIWYTEFSSIVSRYRHSRVLEGKGAKLQVLSADLMCFAEAQKVFS